MKTPYPLLTILLVPFLLILFSCATTPEIRDSSGEIPQKSIAVLEKIPLGGMEQWLLIRGESSDNPVLLWLHGGPGATQMPVYRHYNENLEKEFVVVHWDQRGAGKSNPVGFDQSTLSVDRFIQDARELTKYLKERLNKDKIILLGHSWGSHLGILLARDYPEDYSALVSVGQAVNTLRSHQVSYQWLWKELEKRGTPADRRKLENLGTPPFTDHAVFVRFAKLVDSYGGSMDARFGTLALVALEAPEYNFFDYLNWLRGANRGSGPMWKEYLSFNILRDVPEIGIPVYFFIGRDDYNTPFPLVEEYYSLLKAPAGKRLIIFENSSHTPFIGEPEKFFLELVKVKKDLQRGEE